MQMRKLCSIKVNKLFGTKSPWRGVPDLYVARHKQIRPLETHFAAQVISLLVIHHSQADGSYRPWYPEGCSMNLYDAKDIFLVGSIREAVESLEVESPGCREFFGMCENFHQCFQDDLSVQIISKIVSQCCE